MPRTFGKKVEFVGASYVAIAIMFAIHGILLGLAGVNVRSYFKTVWPVLTCALHFWEFRRHHSPERGDTVTVSRCGNIANLSATFGATIGQNGCAGIYPAMLAVMTAPSMGIDPLSFSFILPLVAIVAISSFGIAGVGGGATFAALVVLPAMGLSRHRGGGVDFRGTAHRYGAHGPQRKRRYDRRRAHGALAREGRGGLGKA